VNIRKSILLRVRIAFLAFLIFGLAIAFRIFNLQVLEVEQWKKKDPIDRLEKDLKTRGILSQDIIDEMKTDMEKRIAAEMKMAEEDPWPGEEHLGLNDVYAPAT